jgi:hypothetical protein
VGEETAVRVGITVTCTVCGRTKQPFGRSASNWSSLCGWECPGYDQSPKVGSLWPGETSIDFGYPCGTDGTIERPDPTEPDNETKEDVT